MSEQRIEIGPILSTVFSHLSTSNSIMDKSLQIPVFIGRITGVFSVVGSSLITYMIMSDRKRKLSRPYHRMMLMMSFFDIIQSLSMVFSVTALPHQSGIYGAKGNKLTCTIQGFLLALGFAVPLYNSCLNIYYVLVIRYNISSEQFSKYEYIAHTISGLFPLSLAVLATIHDCVEPVSAVCLPRGRIFFTTVSLIVSTCFLICIVSMISICWTVLSQAKKTREYTRFNTRNDSVARSSRIDTYKNKTVKQACLYALAFLLTYTVPFVAGVYARGAGADPPYAVLLISSILYPLQGFWNFVFYIRPGVQRVIKLNAEKSYLGAIWDTIFRRNSIERSNIQLLDTKRLPIHALPSNRQVQTDMSAYVRTESNNNESIFSKIKEDSSASENSVLPYVHDTSVDTYSGSIASRVPKSPEVSIMEDDVENQSNIYFVSTKRFSLLASVLDGQDFKDINTEADFSNAFTTDDNSL